MLLLASSVLRPPLVIAAARPAVSLNLPSSRLRRPTLLVVPLPFLAPPRSTFSVHPPCLPPETNMVVLFTRRLIFVLLRILHLFLFLLAAPRTLPPASRLLRGPLCALTLVSSLPPSLPISVSTLSCIQTPVPAACECFNPPSFFCTLHPCMFLHPYVDHRLLLFILSFVLAQVR